MQDMAPYDYSRLVLFEQKAHLTREQCDELDLIIKDLMAHFFSQIDQIMNHVIQHDIKKFEDVTHV